MRRNQVFHIDKEASRELKMLPNDIFDIDTAEFILQSRVVKKRKSGDIVMYNWFMPFVIDSSMCYGQFDVNKDDVEMFEAVWIPKGEVKLKA